MKDLRDLKACSRLEGQATREAKMNLKHHTSGEGALSSEEGTTQKGLRTLPESPGHHLAFSVLYVPDSLDSGRDRSRYNRKSSENPFK